MFYDTFRRLCERDKTSPSAVCKQIGLSNSTAAYWKRSGKAPKRETLEQLAELFGVTVNHLLGRPAEDPEENLPGSDYEAELLQLFRQLSYEQQMQEIGRLRLLAEQSAERKGAIA